MAYLRPQGISEYIPRPSAASYCASTKGVHQIGFRIARANRRNVRAWVKLTSIKNKQKKTLFLVISFRVHSQPKRIFSLVTRRPTYRTGSYITIERFLGPNAFSISILRSPIRLQPCQSIRTCILFSVTHRPSAQPLDLSGHREGHLAGA